MSTSSSARRSTWRRRRHLLLAGALLPGMAVFVPAARAQTTTVETSAAYARAQGVTVETTYDPSPTTPGDVVDLGTGVTRTVSVADSGGIGGGVVKANGSATGLYGDAAGLLDTVYSVADSHVPTDEELSDTGEKASASVLGIATASGLTSESLALDETTLQPEHLASTPFASMLPMAPNDAAGFSGNRSDVAQFAVLPVNDPANPVIPLNADALEEGAFSLAAGGVADAFASSTVARLSAAELGLGTLPIVDGLTLDAIALETEALASEPRRACRVFATTISIPPLIDSQTIQFTCEQFQALVDPLLPVTIPDVGAVDLAFGPDVDTSPFPCDVQVGVAGLRLTALAIGSDTTIELATSEVCTRSRSETHTTDDVCGTTVSGPGLASGSAAARAVRTTDGLDLSETTMATAEAAFDEAGLALRPDTVPQGRGPVGASASGRLLTTDLYLPPNDPRAPLEDPTDRIEVVDTHADAPQAQTETFDLAEVADDSTLGNLTSNLVSGSLVADAVSSAATASTDPDDVDSLSDGDATGQFQVAEGAAGVDLDGDLQSDIDVATSDVVSTANATRTDDGATASATQTIASASSGVLGVGVDATVVDTTLTEATATGVAGGASATTSFIIESVTVAGTSIDVAVLTDDTDGDGNPGPAQVDLVGPNAQVVTVYIGEVTKAIAADGTAASISVNPVRVTVQTDTQLGEVTIGHTDAAAATEAVPAGGGAVITKDLDMHMAYDDVANQITGPAGTPEPNGVVLAPHQKFFYLICIGNAGTETLTDVVVTDTLHHRIRLIPEAPGDTINGVFTVDGRTITTAPTDLAPGEERQIVVYAEVKQDTKLGAVIPNRARMDSVGSGTVTSNQFVINVDLPTDRPALRAKLSISCDRTARVWNIQAKIQNDGGAAAYDARIDQLVVRSPKQGVVGGVPTPSVPVLAPGAASPPFAITVSNVPGAPGTSCGLLQYVFREVGEDADGQLYAFD